MFERFTADAREVVIEAQRCAILRLDEEIGAKHLLLAMADPANPLHDLLVKHGVEPTGEADRRAMSEADETALRSLGIELDKIRSAVESTFGKGALDEKIIPTKPRAPWRRKKIRHRQFSRYARKSLELSLREAIRLGSGEIRSEHIALGVLRADDPDLDFPKLDAAGLRAALETRLGKAA